MVEYEADNDWRLLFVFLFFIYYGIGEKSLVGCLSRASISFQCGGMEWFCLVRGGDLKMWRFVNVKI